MRRLLALLLVTLALTGCATWTVDSEVRTFASMQGVPAGATYRFERLPSQQFEEAAQQQLEAMAGAALDAVGLRRDDAAPQLTAMIGARVTAELSPWADPWWGGGWGGWGGPGWGGAGWGPGPWGPRPGWGARGWYGGGWGGGWYGPGFFGPPPTPWFGREVSIVLRELPSNRVVFETHARNDGPYGNSADILPVMFRAALEGFPNPPQGLRRVDIPLPPRSQR
ncbi:DUF4136 domain-containing protein [Variovorax sp. J22P168]|uniref:DUF4136 domain-containing protein n=1 Tax=Variovorax jilinensis TaxID=3053513 RepID=UPI0025771A4C|nr:DUF4136 domain-containing protein [Variovorax sp. J22P168]MDM0011243.1 DUF4136 domain-containing protein [Variovorax sp. J22P168]